MSAASAITLPHGLWDGRRRRSEAVVRPPTGADEAYLLSATTRTRAEQVTGLLARCVVRIDDLEADDIVARTLTAGDREALLFHLRALAFGDAAACIVDCPACGERMDVDLRITNLLLAPYAEVEQRHTVGFDHDGARGEAVVRLVTGADQEAAARGGGVEELVARCIVEVTGMAEAVPQTVLAEAVSERLAELDPQAEVTIEAVCPDCGEPVRALVDAATVLLAELTAGDDRLLREVDAIARVYHWSEADILDLDVRRRRRYLELLSESGEAS